MLQPPSGSFPGRLNSMSPEGDHAGWLRRLAPSGRYPQNLRSLTAPRTGAILQIPKQRDRARSPANKATGQADARVQAIRDGGRDDPRHRTGGENQETTIQPQTINRTSNDRSGNLDRGPGRLNLQSFSPDKYIHLIKFAPEPARQGSISRTFSSPLAPLR